MKKTTLATAFAELRQKQGLTMIWISKKCHTSETTVWKVENGKSVRWETVHLFLTIAFKVKAGTPEYDRFHQLWLRTRQEMAKAQTEEFATKRLSPHAVAAVRKFREMVRPFSKAKIDRVLYACQEEAGRKK